METTSREVRTERILQAPIQSVWEAWTRPENITHWWGPKGFTSTIHKMEMTDGGEWNVTLHGPDGTNYPNRSIFKEIIPLKKIVFEHFNPHFITTVVFQEKDQQTHLIWTLLFDTIEMREIVVKAHKAEEGQRENIERLEEFLSASLKNKSNG